MAARSTTWITSLLIVLSCSHARADEAISFKRDIAPLLTQQCQSCHGPQKSKGKFRLDTFNRLSSAGASKHAPITSGKPAQSEIYLRLTAKDEDDRMPQKSDPLPRAQIERVKRWIEQGARFDGPDPASPLSSYADSQNPPPPEVYSKPVPITALAFSADGKRLAASGYNEVTLWDPNDGHLLQRISNIPQRTLGLAFSPDCKYLAVAGGTPGSQGELRLIQLDGTASNQLLERISDVMTVVRFSPDGSQLAAGGADNAIRIYDPATRQRRLFIEQHADWVTDLAFNPSGTLLASASRDKSCRIFDVKTGVMDSAYVESVEPVFAVAWRDDGNRIFSAGRDHKIHAWNPLDGKKEKEIPAPDVDLFRLGTASGQLFCSAADGTVSMYSQSTLDKSGEFPRFEDWAYAIAIDPGKNRIAAGCYDGSIRVWEITNAKEVTRFTAAPGYRKESLPTQSLPTHR